nr:precorrin-2 C(20)-methyltransferase [Desulfobulbaceae bacterium]
MTGKFYVVGVGPGDPELLTLRSIRILKESSVLIVPKGKEDGNSTALAIIDQIVPMEDKEIIEIYFPMKKIRMAEKPDADVDAAWQHAARIIVDKIKAGHTVSFPTIGDPAIYSTGFYTCQTLLSIAPEIDTAIVPGVSSIGACAATAGIPLCQGDDMMAVIPATFANDKLTEVFSSFQTVVLMKVYRVMDRIVALLDDLDLLEHALLVERNSHNSERIFTDLKEAQRADLHYFSTIIVRKR